MAVSKDLNRFVRDALLAGQPRQDIAEVLGQAGWSVSEIQTALAAWSETANPVPVPRPQSTVSARDFFVYALTFGLLLFTAIFLVQLWHSLIDIWMNDQGRRSTQDIRWAMAVLVVTLPAYLWLTWRDRRAVGSDPAAYRSVIRKWLIYVTLLATSATMLTVLVVVVYSFLNGDFTLQFVAKAAVVSVISGGIFLYYLRDLRRGDTL